LKLIVQYVETKGVGKETHESTFDGERATIGRGTDQSIQIQDKRIPLAHSTLRLNGNQLLLKAESGNSFTLNDRLSKNAELKNGDVIDILGHQLMVLPGKEDYQHILEIHIDESTAEPLRDRFTTRLRELNFPQRRLAWILFLSIITVGIIIPSAGFFVGMDTIRNSPLPDDSQWLAGELHHTHAFTGNDCEYCHTEPFTQVRDEDCLTCHLSVNHHFDTEFHGADYKIGNKCGACHKEHSGPDSITRQDQAVCTVCHEDLAAVGLESEILRPATDFLLDHPTFRVSMKGMLEDGTWESSRYDVWDDEMEEQSNLIFPHDIHLDLQGIDSPDGSVVMGCSDCHVSEKGGLKMLTVTMEKHCASCHQLTFDPSTPDRVVPHGSPTALMQNLQGYYAYQFLNQSADDSPAPALDLPSVQRQTRRPGKPKNRRPISEFIPEETESVPLTAQAHAYIDKRVNEAAANLFERQTCTICHDITRDDSQEIPWQVKPVKLTDDWYPMAEFSHDSHKNMQCLGCHEAEYSDVAADVLMPDIGSCRSCHGGEEAEGRLQSLVFRATNFTLMMGNQWVNSLL
jgi:predicted CXXCH cytochrome family protein